MRPPGAFADDDGGLALAGGRARLFGGGVAATGSAAAARAAGCAGSGAGSVASAPGSDGACACADAAFTEARVGGLFAAGRRRAGAFGGALLDGLGGGLT